MRPYTTKRGKLVSLRGGSGSRLLITARMARSVGLNSPIAFGVSTRVWNAADWFITLHFVTANLSPAVQGYYFAFNSLGQLSMLVDLGLQILIVEMVSHEAIRLSLLRKGEMTGPSGALSRLVSIGRFSFAWYGIGSIVLFPILVSIGRWLFSGAAAHAEWQWPWLSFCGLVGVDLLLSNFLCLLEGTNDLWFVYSYRFGRTVLTSLTIWASLSLGLKLWAIPLGLLTAIVFTLVYVSSLRPRFMLLFLRKPPKHASVSLREEILPLLWRLSLSTIAGLAAYYLLVPVAFKILGPVAAGQFGMSWMIVDGMTAIALLWPTVNFPTMGSLVARKRWQEFDTLTVRVGIQATVITVLGVITIIFLRIKLPVFNPKLGQRLIESFAFSILACSALPKIIGSVLVFYMRAHCREPIAEFNALVAPLIVGAVALGAEFYGVTGMVMGYFLFQSLIIVPAFALFAIRLRAEWHRFPMDENEGSEALQVE